MTTITENILREGASGQTVAEAEAIISINCGIPDGKGTERWAEIKQHPTEGYDYINQITHGWGGYTVEQMMAGVTLEPTTIELESQLEIVENV